MVQPSTALVEGTEMTSRAVPRDMETLDSQEEFIFIEDFGDGKTMPKKDSANKGHKPKHQSHGDMSKAPRYFNVNESPQTDLRNFQERNVTKGKEPEKPTQPAHQGKNVNSQKPKKEKTKSSDVSISAAAKSLESSISKLIEVPKNAPKQSLSELLDFADELSAKVTSLELVLKITKKPFVLRNQLLELLAGQIELVAATGAKGKVNAELQNKAIVALTCLYLRVKVSQ